MVARERSGLTTEKKLKPLVNKEQIEAFLRKKLDAQSILCTDGNDSYKSFAKKHAIFHVPLSINKAQRVRKNIFHIQNVNAYHSRFKSWMVDFHGLASKYLQNYSKWFKYLDKSKMHINAKEFLLLSIKGLHVFQPLNTL